MKIFILEYFSSRAKDPEQKLSFYNEGLKMLESIIVSALNLVSYEIKTLVHKDFYNRLLSDLNRYDNKLNLSNLNFLKINSDLGDKKAYLNYLENLELKNIDYFLVIAPESDNILADITEVFEQKKIKNLGSSSQTIKSAADKWLFYKNFSVNINVPESKLIDKNLHCLTQNIFPAVVKAKYSAGSELKIVKNEKQFLNYFKKVLCYQMKKRDYIIQKIIPGTPGSISAVSKNNNVSILTINKQLINKRNFSYHGGIINYQFKNTRYLKSVVEQIKERYTGLNGYFGIDFIYNNGEYYFLEINPRFTSSIIGIAELYNFFNLIIPEKSKNKDNKLKIPAEFNNQNFEFKIN
jgi:hypothetical protein